MQKFPFSVEKTNMPMKAFIRKVRARRNLKKIGNGAFAAVYGSKSGRTVLKIGELNSEEECGNHMYLQYLKQTMKYKNNPYFPKVKSVRIFHAKVSRRRSYTVSEHEDQIYMVVEMERLLPLKRNVHGVVFVLDDIIEDRDTFNSVNALVGSKEFIHNIGQVRTVLSPFCECRDLDLRDDNIMLRKNGEVVITDPVA